MVLCCETRSCHARRHNDFERHSKFSNAVLWFLYSVLGTSLLWRSTVAFTYLNVKSAKCLCLLPVVLDLLFWSWSSSCYLILVLRIWSCLHHCWQLQLDVDSTVIRQLQAYLLHTAQSSMTAVAGVVIITEKFENYRNLPKTYRKLNYRKTDTNPNPIPYPNLNLNLEQKNRFK